MCPLPCDLLVLPPRRGWSTGRCTLLATVSPSYAAVQPRSCAPAGTACAQYVTAVVFYAPWCQECTDLDPEFRLAAHAVTGRRILAADGAMMHAGMLKVDGSEHHDLAEQYRITVFPTILIFHK